MITPLFARSCYSLHFGTMSPASLAAEAKAMGHTAVALTDRNGVYGIPAFIEACAGAGIRPIIGTEMVQGDRRALLLARDRCGFSRISRLLTERSEGGLDLPSALLSDDSGLVVLSDDRRLLAGAGKREHWYGLLSPCNRDKWRDLLRMGIPCAATGEASFLHPGDRAVQRLLVAIGGKRTVEEVKAAELSAPEALLSSPEALARLYEGLPEAIDNNRIIAGEAGFSEIFHGFVFPEYEAGHPGGAAGLLGDLVLAGARRRYGSPLGPEVSARIDYELGIIAEKGFASYFLVVKDIVARASRTCGRGSAAASVVSYALGITDVDPVRHGLYFERFLNPGRIDPPDIDVDFAWDERDALLAEVIAGFGEARCARVANHVCFKGRSSLRETARAYGMPDAEISAFERRITTDREKTMKEADTAWKEIAELAPRIAGFPRHLGVHSGGLIVVPDTLADHLPLERTGSGIRVVCWDKEGVEAAGLVKMDLLGNRSLAVVRDALANLEANGIRLDETGWNPIDDDATVNMLARGDTMGVFYVESPAMRQLQQKTGRGDFEHLVIHSSIIRPAANAYISEYVDRLHGKPYAPLHPLIGGILSETYGIMAYQEDVCKVAVALAGFSPAEADRLRKILSKKDVQTRIEAHRLRFFEGARRKKVDEATIAEVWDMIQSFSGYSFVKAHSASYAMLSFRSAYLRAHHPAEFMAAVMSNHGGYYSTLAYASESRRMGLALDPPDINNSALRCVGKGGRILFGFSMIASLGAAAAESIVAERSARGPFVDLGDFSRRVQLDRTEAEALVGSGAFDALAGGPRRAGILMQLLSACVAREREKPLNAEFSFSDSPERADSVPGCPPRCPPGYSLPTRAEYRRGVADSRRKILEAQMRYLSTTIDAHPLFLWPEAMSRPRTLARDLPCKLGRTVELVVWPITAKPVLTSQEELMEFVSFEDETGIFEAVLFPEAYRRFRHLLFGDSPLLVRGRVEKDRGALSVTVEEIRPGTLRSGGAAWRDGRG